MIIIILRRNAYYTAMSRHYIILLYVKHLIINKVLPDFAMIPGLMDTEKFVLTVVYHIDILYYFVCTVRLED